MEVSTAEGVEVSTEAVLVAVAFVAVVGLAATVVVGVATAAIAVAGDLEGWEADCRGAALEEEEAGPRAEVPVADGPVGAGIAGA